jgi:hypothetical protein
MADYELRVVESRGGGNRTLTTAKPLDFESNASTNSATPPIASLLYDYQRPGKLQRVATWRS